MIWINGKWVPIDRALKILALAREIAKTENISHRDALHKARRLLPELDRDVRQDARYRPSRVVLFDDAGQSQPAAGIWA